MRLGSCLGLAASLAVAAALGACARPSPTGVSLDAAVREPSGLALSSRTPGVYWTHGDSGTGNWLFAVDQGGALLARTRLRSTENVDWEAITTDGQGNLWLGDIGNNESVRRDLVVYRIPEPKLGPDLDELVVAERVRFHYPEQTTFGDRRANFDAEALFWWREQLWLLTKHRSDDRTRLYRFPAQSPSDSGEVAVEQVASFDLGPSLEGPRKPWSGQVTAAVVAPDGAHWAMLSYDAVFVFEVPASGEGAQMFDTLVNRVAFDMEVLRQVEAMTWDSEGLLICNEERALFRIPAPLTTARFP